MKIFEETRHALTRLLDRIIIRLFGHKCEKCGSRNTDYGSHWARGWNNWCDQAYGDLGVYCNRCCHITWDKSLAEHIATLPKWCKPYNV